MRSVQTEPGSRRIAVAAMATLALCLPLAPTLAQGQSVPELPRIGPSPRERPLPPEAQGTRAADDGDTPLPEKRPKRRGHAVERNETRPNEAQERERAFEAQRPSPPAPEDPAELRACRAALVRIGAQFEQLSPITPTDTAQDGCGIDTPFSVTEILPDLALSPAGEMRCETALQLARWVKREVLPAARILARHGKLLSIGHASTYVCRSRNNAQEADISEHARGNAIDIASFTFEDGTTVRVSPKSGDGDAEEAFQKAAGSGACLYFTTVLGPGADPYHDDHLHLDVIVRESGYRLCQSP